MPLQRTNACKAISGDQTVKGVIPVTREREKEIKQVVGLTDVEIVYSRPSARGRAVFGNLVPFVFYLKVFYLLL